MLDEMLSEETKQWEENTESAWEEEGKRREMR